MLIPGVRELFPQVVLLGAPATHLRPPLFFSSSPPYFYAGLGTQYYVTTVSRDIFGRAMPGTYFRAESAYFKREKDDSRDILTAFKDRRRFLDISNYEKHWNEGRSLAFSAQHSFRTENLKIAQS